MAGGARFTSCVKQQCSPIVLNGLWASHQIKRFLVKHRLSMSLGTVGTERLWKNWQRMSRNLARSHADESTVYLLTLQRWIREVAARSTPLRPKMNQTPSESPAALQMASVLLEGDTPLGLSEGEENVNTLYMLYLNGQL